MKIILNTFFLLVLVKGSTQVMQPLSNYYTDNFVFTDGYWVYEDTVNLVKDSITITDYSSGGTYPHPNDPNSHEFIKVNYYSHTFSYEYNDYFVFGDHMKRNGGGQYGQLGQPILFGSPPALGNDFNGTSIVDFFTSLSVHGVAYNDVYHVKVFEAQQIEYEYSYDTDIYFAPGTGIIRKAYTDSLGVVHVWDLIAWNADNSTVSLVELEQLEKTVIGVYDLMGRETDDMSNTFLIYVYSDGTTEKVFRID